MPSRTTRRRGVSYGNLQTLPRNIDRLFEVTNGIHPSHCHQRYSMEKLEERGTTSHTSVDKFRSVCDLSKEVDQSILVVHHLDPSNPLKASSARTASGDPLRLIFQGVSTMLFET